MSDILHLYEQAFRESPWLFFAFNIVLGLLVGSFLNVVALRIPAGMSIVHPPSHCGSCGHKLGPLDLIPVLSYVLQRGKCRYCCKPYSSSYAWWEAAAGAAFGLAGLALGPSREWLTILLLISVLLVTAQTDLRGMIIPDKIVIFGLAAGLAVRLYAQPLPYWHYLLGMLVGGGIVYAIGVLASILMKKEAMGGGDVKLFAFIGFILASKLALLTLFLSCLLGTVTGVLLIATGRRGREQHLPFGPFIAAGAFVSALFGNSLIDWYFGFFG